MATEKLKFKLELYATMWDKAPHAEVLIDDKSYFNNEITGTEDKPDLIEFEHELEEGKSYELIIKRAGKGRNQTVIDNQGDILKDQLLHIKNIEIDEIDIGSLVYEGVYTPEYPEPWATQQRESGNELKESFKNVTQMGHNGTWSFKFTSPFYMWLLENLY
jgi:chaperonin GroEL (HSP60 family)